MHDEISVLIHCPGESERESKFYVNVSAVAGADTLALLVKFSDVLLRFECNGLDMASQVTAAPASERPQFALPQRNFTEAERNGSNDFLLLSLHEFVTTVSVDLLSQIGDKAFGSSTNEDPDSLTTVLRIYCSAPKFVRNVVKLEGSNELSRQCVLLHWDAFAVCLAQGISQIQVYIERFGQSGWLLDFFERRRKRQLTRFTFVPKKTATMASMTSVGPTTEQQLEPDSVAAESQSDTEPFMRGSLLAVPTVERRSSGQFNRISAYSKLKGNDRRRARIVRRKAAQELEARSKVPVVVTLDLCAVTLEANLMSSVHFAYKVDHVLCRVERLANGTLTDADFMLKHHRIEVQRMARNGPATPGRPSTSQSRFTDIRLPFPEIAVQATMRQGAIPASTPYAVTPHIVDAVVVVERVQVTLTTDVINQCLFVHYALLKAVDGLVTSVKSLDLIATPSTGDMGGGTGAAEGEAPKKIPVLYCVRGCVKTMSFTATSGNLAVTLSSQTATTYASNYRRAQQPPLTALELANSKGDDLFVDCALDAALTLHDLFATAPNSYWGRFSTGASARATRTMQNGVPTIAVAVLVNRTLLILRPRAVDRGLQWFLHYRNAYAFWQVEFEQFQAAVARATMQVRQELDIQKIVDADSSIFKTVFTLEISNVCVAIPLGALSDTTRAPAEEWPLPALVFHIAQISACASNVNIAYGKLQSFNVQFTGTFDPNDMDTWAPKSDGKPVNVATMPYANFNWVIETSNPYRQTDPRVQNVRGKGKEPETARKASSMVVAVVFDIGGLVLDLHSTVGMYLSMIHHTFQEVTDTLTSSLDPKPIPVPVPTLNAPPSAPQQPPPDGRQSMQDLSVHVTLKISQGAITFRTPRNQPPQQQDTVIGPDVPVPEAEEVPKVSVEDTSIFIPSFGVRGNYQVTQTEKSMAGLEKAPESMTVHVQVGSFSNGITFKPFLLQFIDGAVDEYRAASVQFRSSTPVARLAEPASTPTAVDEEGMGVDNLGNLKVAVFLRMEKSEFSLNCMPKSLINCSIKLPAIDLVFSSIPGRYVTPVGAKKVHRGIRSVTVCLSQCFVRIHHPYSAAESFKIDLSEIRMQGSEQRTPADKNANSASRQSMFQGFGSGIGSESFMSSTSAISMEARKPPRRQLASILADVDQCTVFYNTRQLDELLQFVDMWFSRGYTRTVPQPQASTTALAIDAPAPLNAPSNPQPNVSPQKKPSLKSSSEALATPRYGRLASLGGGLDGSRGELKKKEGGGSGRMDVDLSAALENLGISADTIGLDGPENLLADLTREAKGTATVDAGPTSPKVGGRRESVGKSLRADVVDTDEGDYTARLVPKPATEIQSRRVVGCVRIKTVEIVANLGQAIGKIKLENHQLLAAGHYDTGAQENTTPPDPERFGTEMAGRAIVGDVHLSSFEKSGQALTGLLNGEITLKRLLVIGKGFRPASGIPDVGMGRTVAVTNNMALVALESMDANIKYHANPVLVIELERLQGSFYDQWTYTYGTAVPALDTRTCLLCKYFYILVSKETLPTFRTVAKKFGRLLEEQQGRLLAYSQAQPDAVGSYLQQRANRAAASAKKKAEAAVGRALHYLVNGSVMLAGEEVLLVCFWHSFFDQEWALFFLRHYRLNFQQAMDSAVAKRKCLVELGNGTDQSLAVMKMENKSNMRPGDWTASDWTKHVSSAPVSSYIIQVWRCSVSLKSQHHFASNTIQTWFVTQFPDSIGVSLDVSLYLFLKDTVLLYLSENQRRSKHKADQLPSAQKGEADKSGGGSTSVHSAEETKSQDKVSAHSGEQSRCSSKAKYTCMEFILKPELSLTSYSNMYPPDVEWVLEKLGFKNARHTIPKYMHQALLESLHKLIVQLAQMGSEPLQREMLPPPKPALDNTQSAGHLPGPQSGPNLVPRRQRSSMKTRPLSSAL